MEAFSSRRAAVASVILSIVPGVILLWISYCNWRACGNSVVNLIGIHRISFCAVERKAVSAGVMVPNKPGSNIERWLQNASTAVSDPYLSITLRIWLARAPNPDISLRLASSLSFTRPRLVLTTLNFANAIRIFLASLKSNLRMPLKANSYSSKVGSEVVPFGIMSLDPESSRHDAAIFKIEFPLNASSFHARCLMCSIRSLRLAASFNFSSSFRALLNVSCPFSILERVRFTKPFVRPFRIPVDMVFPIFPIRRANVDRAPVK